MKINFLDIKLEITNFLRKILSDYNDFKPELFESYFDIYENRLLIDFIYIAGQFFIEDEITIYFIPGRTSYNYNGQKIYSESAESIHKIIDFLEEKLRRK